MYSDWGPVPSRIELVSVFLCRYIDGSFMNVFKDLLPFNVRSNDSSFSHRWLMALDLGLQSKNRREYMVLKVVYSLCHLVRGLELWMKCLTCKYLKKGIVCSGKREVRVAYVENSTLWKKCSARKKGSRLGISMVEFTRPGGKSGFCSIGVRGPGEDAVLRLLHAILKWRIVACISGWSVHSLGIVFCEIHGRWDIGKPTNDSSSLIQSLLSV